MACNPPKAAFAFLQDCMTKLQKNEVKQRYFFKFSHLFSRNQYNFQKS